MKKALFTLFVVCFAALSQTAPENYRRAVIGPGRNPEFASLQAFLSVTKRSAMATG